MTVGSSAAGVLGSSLSTMPSCGLSTWAWLDSSVPLMTSSPTVAVTATLNVCPGLRLGTTTVEVLVPALKPGALMLARPAGKTSVNVPPVNGAEPELRMVIW